MKVKFTKKALEFLDKHSVAISDGVKTFVSLVGGIAFMGLGGVILKLNGIDISYGEDSAAVTPEEKKPQVIDYNEVAEVAIEKALSRALDVYYDSEKELAAKDIRDIAMREGVTTAKMTAINALSQISDDVFYDSTKTKIGGYIKEIAMGL